MQRNFNSEILTANTFWNGVQITQGIRPLWGVYIPHFAQISVKMSVLGVLYPYCCTDGSDIWHGGGDHAKFHPHRCNVSQLSPLWGEKAQNRPLSNLNNRHYALHAMLPVNKSNTNALANENCALKGQVAVCWKRLQPRLWNLYGM